MEYRNELFGKGDGDYATFLTVSQVIATRRRREQAGWCPGEHSHPLIALLKMRHFCSLSDESQAVPIPSRRSRRRGRVHRAARLVPRRIPTGRRRASPTACGCHRTRSSPPPHHRNPWTRATLTTGFHGLAGIRREPPCSHHRGHQLHPSSSV